MDNLISFDSKPAPKVTEELFEAFQDGNSQNLIGFNNNSGNVQQVDEFSDF